MQVVRSYTASEMPCFPIARKGSENNGKFINLFRLILTCCFFFVFLQAVLRQWSKELDCPILSVDYSLAPEAPFPEGFEECFYAYSWALKHADQLGEKSGGDF